MILWHIIQTFALCDFNRLLWAFRNKMHQLWKRNVTPYQKRKFDAWWLRRKIENLLHSTLDKICKVTWIILRQVVFLHKCCKRSDKHLLNLHSIDSDQDAEEIMTGHGSNFEMSMISLTNEHARNCSGHGALLISAICQKNRMSEFMVRNRVPL